MDARPPSPRQNGNLLQKPFYYFMSPDAAPKVHFINYFIAAAPIPFREREAAAFIIICMYLRVYYS